MRALICSDMVFKAIILVECYAEVTFEENLNSFFYLLMFLKKYKPSNQNFL